MKKVSISLIMLITFTMCTSCIASPKNEIKTLIEITKDDGFGKVMKDSISNIIFESKRIVCELQSKSPEDSLRQDSVIVIPSKLISVVQYLFFDVNNFKSNDVVYGKFDSWVCYKFESRKKQILFLEIDFGLSKWRLLDKNKTQICMQDMKENNLQFIRLTRLLFPKDKTLNMLYNNLNKQK